MNASRLPLFYWMKLDTRTEPVSAQNLLQSYAGRVFQCGERGCWLIRGGGNSVKPADSAAPEGDIIRSQLTADVPADVSWAQRSRQHDL